MYGKNRNLSYRFFISSSFPLCYFIIRSALLSRSGKLALGCYFCLTNLWSQNQHLHFKDLYSPEGNSQKLWLGKCDAHPKLLFKRPKSAIFCYSFFFFLPYDRSLLMINFPVRTNGKGIVKSVKDRCICWWSVTIGSISVAIDNDKNVASSKKHTHVPSR